MWNACYYLPDFAIASERVLHPDFQGVPLALEGEHGLLQAVSSEAEEAGVRLGQKPSAARIFCTDLLTLPYRAEVYNHMAEPLWDRIACDSSCVEPVSPEVCFAAFTGAGIRERAIQIAEDLNGIAGVTVHMGMSLSRFTAHIAARCDPGGAPVVVLEGRETSVVASVPVEELPHSDRQECDRLRRLGISVLGDILSVPEEEFRRAFRERSYLLRRLALGQDREPIRALWPPDNEEHVLNLDFGITEEALLHEAIRQCAAGVAEKLRRRGRRCRSVTLALRSETGRAYVRTEVLSAPEQDAGALMRVALRLLGRMTADNPSLFHAPPTGVMLRALVAEPAESVQMALFDENRLSDVLPHERRKRLEAAMEFVCERFGSKSVGKAAELRRTEPFQIWTYPLTRRLNEAVTVRTDPSGVPVRYRRHGVWWDIEQVQNRWAEAGWQYGHLEQGMVFRVETPSLGLAELRCCGSEWRLTAVAD